MIPPLPLVPSPAAPPSPSLSRIAAAESTLIEEWKVIQVKLDKIGEFKFHVKNWAFTLTLAIIVGGVSAGAAAWAVAVAAMAPALAFWGLEKKQDNLVQVFGGRAKVLEVVARRNAELREDILVQKGFVLPSSEPLFLAHIATLADNEEPGGSWLKADARAYLLMLLIAIGGGLAAHFRIPQPKQNVAGELTIKFAPGPIPENPFSNGPTADPAAHLRDLSTGKASADLYDANGNRLP